MSTTTTTPIDFSSLPQDQQQQLQQLQLQFQEHQQQQQKAAAEAAEQQAQQQQLYHHDYAAAQAYDPSQIQAVYDPSQVQAAYDPSQVQAYDQSYYAAYYPYQDPNQVQNPQQVQYQQQHYAYYQPDYASVYQPQPQPQPQQHYPQPESAQIHQPALHEQPPPQPEQQQYSQPELAGIHQPAPVQAVEPSRPMAGPPPVGLGQVQVQHQKKAYYPQQVGPGGDQNSGSPSMPQGLNPAAAAAVAALSQLTQFAGTMDAAERAMVGLQERQWYGRAGGYGPAGFPPQFMGPGPMHHRGEPMRPQAGRSQFRGGGRRGGDGGPFRGGGRGSFGNRPPRAEGLGPHSRGRGRGCGRGGVPHRRPPQSGSSSSSHQEQPSGADVAESSEEEPEPHADNQAGPTVVARCETCKADCNSLEMLEKHNNGKRHKKNLQRLEELKSAYEPLNDPNPEATSLPETAEEGDENKPTVPESLPGNEKKPESGKPWMNRVENQRHGMKRNMRAGGPARGKRARTFDAPARRPIEPHKPKVVIPLICELCNVKCDTREVFNCHLSGKKHISKLKRFEDHQAMYGPSGLQALYPPNPISQTYAHPPQGPPHVYHGPQGYPHPAHHAPPPPPENNFPLQFAGQNSIHGPHAPVGPEMNQISAIQMYGGNGLSPP